MLGAPTSSSTTSKGPCSSKPSGAITVAPKRSTPARSSSRRTVATTRAPAARPSWMAAVPTPPAPPCTSSRSPGRRPAWLKSASCAVVKTSGSPPACGPVEPLGHRHRGALVHQGQLGVAASAHDRHHPVALREALRAGAAGRHLARQLETGNVRRRARRGRIAALELEHVRPVQAGRAHPHQHLSGAGRGVGPLLHHQPPVLDRHRAHAANLVLTGRFGAATSIRPQPGLWWDLR